MTEKQTTTSESSQASNDEPIISDAELAMLKEWEVDSQRAADAARRTVDTSSDTYSVPNTVDTVEVPTIAPSANKLSRKNVATGAAATALIVAGAAGLSTMGGGEDNSDRGEVDSTVNSVTLSPDARVRQDPFVDSVLDEPNMLFQPGAQVEIDANSDVRVLEGTNNGTWYGLDVEDVAAKIPNAEGLNDKDGIVWVNEAGVESVDKDASEESNE